jgi:hypothetical protein
LTKEEAEHRLLIHAGLMVEGEEQNFTRRLRPYQGLDDGDFAELIQCVMILHPDIAGVSTVDRKLCAALWWICEHSRILALRPQSALRRNKLITERDLARLERWVEVFEYFSIKMLMGLDLVDCAYQFLVYIGECSSEDLRRYEFALPLAEQAQRSDDSDIAEAANQAYLLLRGP